MLTFALTTQQRLQRASVAFADLLCMRILALYPGIAHNHYGQGIFFTHILLAENSYGLYPLKDFELD